VRDVSEMQSGNAINIEVDKEVRWRNKGRRSKARPARSMLRIPKKKPKPNRQAWLAMHRDATALTLFVLRSDGLNRLA
jgi:hypothetical protein